MKSLKQILTTGTILFLLFFGFSALAQEEDKIVHLKVIKNGEILVDTSFTENELDEEGLHKKIKEITGMDIDVSHSKGLHKEHKMHISAHAGDEHAMVWVSDDEDGKTIIKSDKIIVKTGDEGEESENVFVFDGDSMMIIKEGNVLMLGEGDEQIEWIEVEKGEKEGDRKVIVKKKKGEGDDTYAYVVTEDKKMVMKEGENYSIITTGEKGDHKVVTVKSKDGKEKSYSIVVTGDEGDVKIKDMDAMNVYVSDDESGTVFVRSIDVKKMKEEGSDEITIVVEIVEKEKGAEKKKEKTKQKVNKDRKQK